MDFIYNVLKKRREVLSDYMLVSLERMDRQVFKNYIRNTSNPVKRAAAIAVKEAAKKVVKNTMNVNLV